MKSQRAEPPSRHWNHLNLRGFSPEHRFPKRRRRWSAKRIRKKMAITFA